MSISIVNRTVFSSNGTTPTSCSIPSTTSGHTIVVCATDTPPYNFSLGSMPPTGSFAVNAAVMFYWIDIPGGVTTLNFAYLGDPPAYGAVIYELTPCTFDNGFGSSTPASASETCGTITASGNDAFFTVICQYDTSTGSYGGVNSPWVLDYSGSFTDGFGDFYWGAVAYILNGSGPQTATFAASVPFFPAPPAGTAQACFLDTSIQYIIYPIIGPIGTIITVTPGFTPPVTVTVGGIPTTPTGNNPVVFPAPPGTGTQPVVINGISVGNFTYTGEIIVEPQLDTYPAISTSNTFMRFRLRNFAGKVPLAVPATLVAITATLGAVGTISQNLIPNTAIFPPATFYTVESWSNGRITSSANVVLTASGDLSTLL